MAWYGELAPRILPRPTSAPAGDKPPHYTILFRHLPSVYNPVCRGMRMTAGCWGHLCHPLRPLDSGFRRSDESGGYPGSWSGTCFRSNRSCRQGPAHQGMKSWSCGLVRRIGTADSATPLLRPSGGQAPALHFLIPPSTIGPRLGRIRRWRVGIEVDWRAHLGSESGTCLRTKDILRCRPPVRRTPSLGSLPRETSSRECRTSAPRHDGDRYRRSRRRRTGPIRCSRSRRTGRTSRAPARGT